jgi:DUF1680 family protein
MALAVQAAYLKSRLHGEDVLAVSTFETSQVKLKLGGRDVTVEQRNRFPREGSSLITFRLAQPARFGLLFRVPPWASPLTLEVGKKPVQAEVKDGWAMLPAREWKDGDRIGLSFRLGPEMRLGGFTNSGRAALSWGPFVLAYDQSRNPGLPEPNIVGLVSDSPLLTLDPEAVLAWRGKVLNLDSGNTMPARFVPFADAGSSAGTYRVWLWAPRVGK